jgi:hypothetical protein
MGPYWVRRREARLTPGTTISLIPLTTHVESQDHELLPLAELSDVAHLIYIHCSISSMRLGWKGTSAGDNLIRSCGLRVGFAQAIQQHTVQYVEQVLAQLAVLSRVTLLATRLHLSRQL